jgi:hypothetical protein
VRPSCHKDPTDEKTAQAIGILTDLISTLRSGNFTVEAIDVEGKCEQDDASGGEWISFAPVGRLEYRITLVRQ